MPDLLVVLLDGAVGGEHAALRHVDDLLARPRLLIEVVVAKARLRLLIGAEVLEHQIRIGHAAVVGEDQRAVEALEHLRVVRRQAAVKEHVQRAAQLGVRLVDVKAAVGARGVERLDLLGAHAEDVAILLAHQLGDLHVRAVERAGAVGCLVLSGETTMEVAREAPRQPDLIARDIQQLGEWLAESRA